VQNQLQISEQEQRLILDLLRAERDELPTEIHHTDNPDMSDQLKQRMDLVDGLINRLQASARHPA